jgi:hypothetical protein
MSVVTRFLLPSATAMAAALTLVTAAPRQLDPALASPRAESLEQAEPGRCVGTGRGADACPDEADGKALAERADWLARADGPARRGSRP